MAGLLYPKNPGKKKRRKQHPKSIMHPKDGTCYLCIALHGDYRRHPVVQEHHIFGGPNRELSEEYGLKVYLDLDHHLTGPEAVHRNAETADFLHREGQRAFERVHGSREQFVKIFGRNWLD